jgi:D-arabinitol 4-dehydrogenase
MSAPLVMLHLGLGFFHRAHQALYLHRLIESGDNGWVLAGGNTRPDAMELMASLAAQGGAYTLETVTPRGERSYTKITAIKTVVPYSRAWRFDAIGAEPRRASSRYRDGGRLF